MGETDRSAAERVRNVVMRHVGRAPPALPLPWESPLFGGGTSSDTFLPDLPVATAVVVPPEAELPGAPPPRSGVVALGTSKEAQAQELAEKH